MPLFSPRLSLALRETLRKVRGTQSQDQTPSATSDYERRSQRLREILDELASLTNWKRYEAHRGGNECYGDAFWRALLIASTFALARERVMNPDCFCKVQILLDHASGYGWRGGEVGRKVLSGLQQQRYRLDRITLECSHMPLFTSRLSLARQDTLRKLRGTQSQDSELEEVRIRVLRFLAELEVPPSKSPT